MENNSIARKYKKIVIDDIILKFLPKSEITKLYQSGSIEYGKKPTNDVDNQYFVSWGTEVHGIKKGIIETGFFRDAVHIDPIGLYENCSLNHPSTKNIIENYNAPESSTKIFNSGKILTKVSQKNYQPINWNGVILAGQYQNDRSILRVGTTTDYRNFVENSCKYYGKNLYVKMHPVMTMDVDEVQWITNLSKRYGCEVGNTDISIINNAELVVTYNSTIAVDCLFRKKHVMQFAPGYFWQTGVVQYTNRKIGVAPFELDKRYAEKFLDFILWKYCFNKNSSIKNLISIIQTYANSNDIFPLADFQSYGGTLKLEMENENSHLGGHSNITHVDIGALGYIKKTLKIESMIDVGCGKMGMFPIACGFKIKYTGIDGDPNLNHKSNFVSHDYKNGPCVLDQKYDLGWSVEFVEHVDQQYLNNFMDSFKRCKYVCITHALPGKVGHHHVNCQPSEYWINVFADNGFEYSEAHTKEIKANSSMKREFMCKTGMLFINKNI